jgi:phenylalanine-4-hydroxylase
MLHSFDQFAEALTPEPHRSEEDIKVWNIALDSLVAISEISDGLHTETYLKGLRWFAGFRDRIPTQLEINAWLRPTGWRTVYASGYVPVSTYQLLHERRIFPIARPMRKLRDIDHSAAPDFLHDALGHLPMLFDPDYARLLEEWGRIGQSAPPTEQDRAVATALSALIDAHGTDETDADEITILTARLDAAHEEAWLGASRCTQFETFYTWAIEYGFLAGEDGSRRLIGAAALSSRGELRRILNGDPAFRPFSSGAIGRPVNYTTFQDVFFEARGFDEYHAILNAL